MARSVLIPVDDSAESDRALVVGVTLAARAGLPVELVHVHTGLARRVDEQELVARAAAVAPLACRATVLHHEDPVEALTAAFGDHPDDLVVLGTSARGPLGELLLGSVSEALLARVDHPLLLVGPQVVAGDPLGPSLVAAVADRRTGELLVDPVVDWASLLGADPWFVQVAEPTVGLFGRRADLAETGLVHRLAERARAGGLDAQWDVLHGRSAPASLVDFAVSMGGGIVAVASERWVDPDHVHWASTARALVHRSPFPVLVVPVHLAAVPG